MDTDTMLFFEKMPGALALYECLQQRLSGRLEAYSTRVQKSQITLSSRYNFACVSLPKGKRKGNAEATILVTFGLNRQAEDPRIAVSTEPYPNRWTHHVPIQSEGEIDAQLLDWLEEAYHFSMSK